MRFGGRLSPIHVWATTGVASVVLAAVVLGRWVGSGISMVGPGPDRFEGILLLRVLEWGQFTALLGLLGWFVARPLVRRRPLGFDGLFVLSALALNFWDPLDNYLRFAFQYNAHLVNLSSWGGFIPGWQSPAPELWAVPIPFVLGAYTWAFFAAARIGCALLERLTRSRPRWGISRRLAAVVLTNAGLAAAAELAYLGTGSIANVGTPAELTLGGGYDGWPVYNPLFFGLAFTAGAWLRWSRDESGLSAVERGADRLGSGPRATTVARYLAISAFLQVSYILLYFVPWNLLALAGGEISTPSYFPTP